MTRAIRWGGLILGFAIVSAGCLAGGCLLGGLMREGAIQHEQFLAEKAAVAPLLASDPAFARVTIRELSRGGIILEGEVPTSEDRDRLHRELIDLFGRERAHEMLLPVVVHGPSPDTPDVPAP